MRIYAPILTIYSIYLVNIAKISIHPEIYTENYSLIVYYYFLSKVGISLIELDKRNIEKYWNGPITIHSTYMVL